jgi:hypothetical protein
MAVCGAGGGGKGSMDDNQLAAFQVFRKLVASFDSGPSKDLDYHLEQMLEVMRDHADPYEITQEVLQDMKSLDKGEKAAVNEFLLNHGETELIPE